MALGDVIGSALEVIVGLFDAWGTKKNNESKTPIKKDDGGSVDDSVANGSPPTQSRYPHL